MSQNCNALVNQISDKITENPNIPLDVADKDISKYIKRTLIKMADLFNIKIQTKKGEIYNIPNELATLVEIEVIYQKQKNTSKPKILVTLINYIMNNQWDKITADDIRSFFLPIFNYNRKENKYFQDLEEKLNFCLDYYSMLNPNSIPSYLSDDITSFINCVYYQNELSARDYEKLMETINNGEI